MTITGFIIIILLTGINLFVIIERRRKRRIMAVLLGLLVALSVAIYIHELHELSHPELDPESALEEIHWSLEPVECLVDAIILAQVTVISIYGFSIYLFYEAILEMLRRAEK